MRESGWLTMATFSRSMLTWFLTSFLILGCVAVTMAQQAPPPQQADSAPPPSETWAEEDADQDESHADGDRDADSAGFDGDDAATAAAGVAAASGMAMVGLMGVWFILYFGFIFFMVMFSTAVMLASVLAIYDCARRDFPDPNTRALWCILIVLTRWIGALIYYIAVYRADDPPLQQARLQS